MTAPTTCDGWRFRENCAGGDGPPLPFPTSDLKCGNHPVALFTVWGSFCGEHEIPFCAECACKATGNGWVLHQSKVLSVPPVTPVIVRKFIKKPLPVEMVQFTTTNGDAVVKWVGSDATFFPGGYLDLAKTVRDPSIQIKTLEGVFTARVGDWIARGVRGEHYIINNAVHCETYDPLCEHCGTAHRDCDPCL